jgi:hypothetical protein
MNEELIFCCEANSKPVERTLKGDKVITKSIGF